MKKEQKSKKLTQSERPMSSHEAYFQKFSNAKVSTKSEKLDLKFPQQGIFKLEKHKFSDKEDLLTYLSTRFPNRQEGKLLGGRIKRTGKYQRIDEKDNPIFTFGDPILDLITDKDGTLTIGNRAFDLRSMEMMQQDSRGGGNLLIDYSSYIADFSKYQLLEAISGLGKFTIEECNKNRIVISSNNPHILWFYQPGTSRKMRFRAFKKNYFAYWKMGSDIETWGQNFTKASIQSRYGEFLGSVCVTIKTDSDSDTNDDYVDEYEWGTFGTPKPDGIQSACVATWGGQIYSGSVSLGCTVVDV